MYNGDCRVTKTNRKSSYLFLTQKFERTIGRTCIYRACVHVTRKITSRDIPRKHMKFTYAESV